MFWHDYFTHEEGRPPKVHPNPVVRYPLLVVQSLYFFVRSMLTIFTPPWKDKGEK